MTKKVLVTGATGYIGGRLVPLLLEHGYQVRVAVRDKNRIVGRYWFNQVEVVECDLLEADSLSQALTGVDAAYYLVHSMSGKGKGFEDRDRIAAHNFVAQARDPKLVIYLGGLVPKGLNESAHLNSRAEVGDILREQLPVTEFRAGPVIGSGSASFEMIRYLTERLPVMVCPRWIRNEVSPIAVDDVLAYLLAALEQPPLGVIDIGTEGHSFKELMIRYGKLRGLRRRIFTTPVLAPKLAARWVGFITPIPNSLAVPLVQGVVHTLHADTSRATAIFPDIAPMAYEDAVSRALQSTFEDRIETRWSDALLGTASYQLDDREGLIREARSMYVDATPQQVFREISSLGGNEGWMYWNWAWRLRGLIDRLIGGPGLRRGRRHPHKLIPGDALDFWRVEKVVPGELLRLRAEMKVPGKAWLQWKLREEGSGCRVSMEAFFEPRGFGGIFYWKSLYLAHRFIFSGMMKGLARRVRKMGVASSQAGIVTHA